LNIEHIINAAVERGASDLHIKAGDVFRARIDGDLRPLTKQRLTPEQTKAIALKMIPTQAIRETIDTLRDYDCTWGAPGIGRFRVNILRQRSSFMIVLRFIPFDIPSFDKLGHPPALVDRLITIDHGIVLVSGGPGTGRSSTVAAFVHHINTTVNRHLVTLESPIEFLHRDLQSSVTQREVGVDTEDFTSGLQASLRQDPDVVVVQELFDHTMIDTAMAAAETGRLVVSTLHTADVTSTLARLVAMFPPREQDVARLRIADTLKAVICQRLLAREDEKGRCLVCEILLVTPEIREAIRDRARAGDIYALMADGRESQGTQTFEQHLLDLRQSGVISQEAARAAARDDVEFDRLCGAAEGHDMADGQERRRGKRERRRGIRDRRR
jgi:twitching motility protein PilT